MKGFRALALLPALVLVAVPLSAAAAQPRHSISGVAMALHADGVALVQSNHPYAGVCPQLLPRGQAAAFAILVSSSLACDAVIARRRTLTHVHGSRWVFAARFDNVLLLYPLVNERFTDRSQALVSDMAVFAVIDS